MKKNKIQFRLLFLFVITSITINCSKDDKTSSPGITVAQVNTIITEGTWDVSLYNEAGSIQTSDFSGYSFAFNSNGTLLANAAGTSKTGTWSSTTDSGSVKIPIAFPDETNEPFKSITDDWLVLTATNIKVELKHVSGEDGSIDLLTFEKN
jgi:hypothetical protein